MNMDSREIKKWLIDENLRQADIARALSISNEGVSQVINNRKTNARVRQWLLDQGCPEEYLYTEKTAA